MVYLQFPFYTCRDIGNSYVQIWISFDDDILKQNVLNMYEQNCFWAYLIEYIYFTIKVSLQTCDDALCTTQL